MTPAESKVYLLWSERNRYLGILSEEVPRLVKSFIGEVVRGDSDLHEWAAAQSMQDGWIVSALEENCRIWRGDRLEGFVEVEAARDAWRAEAEKLRGDPEWAAAAVSGRLEFRFFMPMRFVRNLAELGLDGPTVTYVVDKSNHSDLVLEYRHFCGELWPEFKKRARKLRELELAALESHFTKFGMVPQGRPISNEDLRLLARYQANLLRDPLDDQLKRIERAAKRLGLKRRPRNKRGQK